MKASPSLIPKNIQKSRTSNLEKPKQRSNFFILPEMFYVNLTDLKRKPSKMSLKTRLSVLSDFGIIPGKGQTIRPKVKKQTFVETSIKLSDLMGKKNARMIFKSIDFDSIVQSAKSENIDQEKIKKLFGMMADPRLFRLGSADPRNTSPLPRKMMTANGPRNLMTKAKELSEINKIFKSCDDLTTENKKIHRLLKDSAC
jgi:hypothetical protein